MIAIKSKAILSSVIAGYVASTMRYFKQKREGKNPTFAGWFAFGVTACLVTFSAYHLLVWSMPDIPEGVKLTIIFWCGYSSDYFYEWVPKLIKEYIQKRFNNNKNTNQ